MLSIFRKEINAFFSSLVGYIVVGIFLVAMGLWLWVFPASSILESGYATLDMLFSMAPMIFLFLIPAITMRSFAEEKQSGTIELLVTRPLSDWQIVGGKFLASLALVVFALLPTVLYYITVYQLGAPKGNLDSGGIAGSYIGLLFLAGAFAAIGIFASALTNNQIVAFVLATFLCFFVYLAFDALSRLPVFFGKTDDIVQAIGIQYHYESMSRGVLDTRDIIYFLSVIAIFMAATVLTLGKRRW
ncbi:MAG TPA: gliding motility-associated ABC transporter permease subunit GldF [Saprospiraceae bacterium]|nr:gliding motility-associated ABC transporter permease subunit GldF [Saprospiraceae bacterium]HNM25816.1 gliding motility-associated ABC transporter permease subunit GldF [Saprospiraceae bacterium]